MRTTVAAALKEFDLISAPGSLDDKTACAMTLLAWLDECDEWTDHPICAHPIITDQVIKANDASTSTKEMRGELVKLGTKGVLDTWWIPAEVIAWSLAGKRDDPDEADLTQYDRTIRSLKRLIDWKKNKTRPYLSGAYLSRAYLSGANLSGAYGTPVTGAPDGWKLVDGLWQKA